MKVTVLGSGWSGGVPVIGGNWGQCNPDNPKNRRLRPSVLVEEGDVSLLIDTSPDIREQLLRAQAKKLSAVLYTHAHADHSHGIDDLRAMNWCMKAPIDIYGDQATMDDLQRRFDYIFRVRPEPQQYYKPALVPHVLDGPLEFGALTVTPFNQNHVHMNSVGYRIGDFAYSTDVKEMPEAAFSVLAGVKVWVVDCIRREPHKTHSHLQQTLQWIERIKPQKAYLTHMDISMDYDALCGELPPHIRPAFDGLTIEI